MGREWSSRAINSCFRMQAIKWVVAKCRGSIWLCWRKFCMFFQLFTEMPEKRRKPLEKTWRTQWRTHPEITDFCPLAWSNVVRSKSCVRAFKRYGLLSKTPFWGVNVLKEPTWPISGPFAVIFCPISIGFLNFRAILMILGSKGPCAVCHSGGLPPQSFLLSPLENSQMVAGVRGMKVFFIVSWWSHVCYLVTWKIPKILILRSCDGNIILTSYFTTLKVGSYSDMKRRTTFCLFWLILICRFFCNVFSKEKSSQYGGAMIKLSQNDPPPPSAHTNLNQDLLMALLLMGCFPRNLGRENGPFRHSGKRPIKEGKPPIKADRLLSGMPQ